MIPNNKCSKIIRNFTCENCNYKCCKLSIFNKHLSTNKHKTLNIIGI